jgi:hypothetical protein
MAAVSVKHNVAALRRELRRWPKQVAFASANAITKTAWDSKRAVDKQLKTKLDRPTPFTLKAVSVDRATKTKQRAVVAIRPNRWQYLQWVIDGGTKRPAHRALTMPVGVKTNKHGNMTRSTVKRLLAKRAKTGHGSTFSGVPRGQPGAKPGIYMRLGRGKAKGRANLSLMVGYRRHANYRGGIIPFNKIVKNVVRNRMPRNVEAAVKQALTTRR